jgi:hypothetical protein
MRIAQVAPLAESVPPKFYGGTEGVVSWLTEDLVELGHSVTLFASGDSLARGCLFRCGRLLCGSADLVSIRLLRKQCRCSFSPRGRARSTSFIFTSTGCICSSCATSGFRF